MMNFKTCLVGLAITLGSMGHAAVPPGMQDTELKDTLIYLAQEKQLVRATDIQLFEARLVSSSGAAMIGFTPALLLLPRLRADLQKSFKGLSVGKFAGVGAGLLAIGALTTAVAKHGRATFDRDWIIERQHFRDLRRFFNSELEVQYVIASDNSDLREYLMDLAAWIKASKADEETLTPSLKYQDLVPAAQ